MERTVEFFVAIQLVVIGLSHALRPGAWVAFFEHVRELGTTGVLMIGLWALAFGGVVVSAFPVGSGLTVLLAVLGWANVAKGVVYLVAPGAGLAALDRVKPERQRSFVVVGVALIALGGTFAVHLATA